MRFLLLFNTKEEVDTICSSVDSGRRLPCPTTKWGENKRCIFTNQGMPNTLKGTGHANISRLHFLLNTPGMKLAQPSKNHCSYNIDGSKLQNE